MNACECRGDPPDQMAPLDRSQRVGTGTILIPLGSPSLRSDSHIRTLRTLFTATPSGQSKQMRHSAAHLKPHKSKVLRDRRCHCLSHKPTNISPALTKVSSCLQQHQERARDASMTHTIERCMRGGLLKVGYQVQGLWSIAGPLKCRILYPHSQPYNTV